MFTIFNRKSTTICDMSLEKSEEVKNSTILVFLDLAFFSNWLRHAEANKQSKTAEVWKVWYCDTLFSCAYFKLESCSTNLFNPPNPKSLNILMPENRGGIISPMQSRAIPNHRNGSSREPKKHLGGWRCGGKNVPRPRRGDKSHGKHGSQNTGRNLTGAAGFLFCFFSSRFSQKEEDRTNQIKSPDDFSRTARFFVTQADETWKNKKIMLPITTQH